MSGVTPAELGEHAFLRGMSGQHLAILARACWVAPLRAGHRLFEEGGTAQRFWLLQSGQIALDLHAPGRTGLIVEAGNHEQLAQALLRLLRNPEEAAKMGAAGRERVKSEFNWESVGAKIASELGIARAQS